MPLEDPSLDYIWIFQMWTLLAVWWHFSLFPNRYQACHCYSALHFGVTPLSLIIFFLPDWTKWLYLRRNFLRWQTPSPMYVVASAVVKLFIFFVLCLSTSWNLSRIMQRSLSDTSWWQASLPFCLGGLGLHKSTYSASPAFLGSCNSIGLYSSFSGCWSAQLS